MTGERSNNNCSTSNCYAVTALCVSFLVLGLVLGNWIGKCSKNKTYNPKKCKSYKVDGKAGSTCTWPKAKACAADCTKDCCAKK